MVLISKLTERFPSMISILTGLLQLHKMIKMKYQNNFPHS